MPKSRGIGFGAGGVSTDFGTEDLFDPENSTEHDLLVSEEKVEPLTTNEEVQTNCVDVINGRSHYSAVAVASADSEFNPEDAGFEDIIEFD